MNKFNSFPEIEDMFNKIENIVIIDGYGINEPVTFQFDFHNRLENIELKTTEMDNSEKFREKWFEFFKYPCCRFPTVEAWDHFVCMLYERAEVIDILDELQNKLQALSVKNAISVMDGTLDPEKALDKILVRGEFCDITESRVKEIINYFQFNISLNVTIQPPPNQLANIDFDVIGTSDY